MPISLTWEDRAACILRKTYWGVWTWDEYKKTDRKIRLVVASTDKRMDIIIDMRATSYLAPAVVDTVRPYIETLNLNGGLNVVVGGDMIRDVVQVLNYEIPPFRRLHSYARSMERARAFIDADRAGRMWTDDLLPDILNE